MTNTISKTINIAIIHHEIALPSAVFGLEEIFLLANRVCDTHHLDIVFNPQRITQLAKNNVPHWDVIILPPCIAGQNSPTDAALLKWLIKQHKTGSLLTSICVGAFTLAATGLLAGRTITTHWSFADEFRLRFPNQPVDIQRILIDHGDVISAGGVMSWLDLGLALIAKYSSQFVKRQVGKTLVMDTKHREQSFYQEFTPNFSHGDLLVIQAQQWLAQHLSQKIEVRKLAEHCHLSERTLQRRFMKATRLSPNQYLQRLRIQAACDLLETTRQPFESIAYQIGYLDSSACRKTFIKIMGLTPNQYRKRF
ncbi:transcriptional regulator, AraC family [Marinomonas posidonica IVIA-Po-181]|uniref:Transcriptional regulator, AraC family n=2 Tax=Marinomonas TaxID=28253 RepID=F6CSX0_MARPP|nr:transcriptional regulator, AraC family [Marinomonas posidonica IVIA-Po-181]